MITAQNLYIYTYQERVKRKQLNDITYGFPQQNFRNHPKRRRFSDKCSLSIPSPLAAVSTPQYAAKQYKIHTFTWIVTISLTFTRHVQISSNLICYTHKNASISNLSHWTVLLLDKFYIQIPEVNKCFNIQGVSRLEDITAWDDFLGLCDQKVHINMCPILDGYGVMTAWNLEEKVTNWQ